MEHSSMTTADILEQLKTSLSDSNEVQRLLQLLFESFEKEDDLDLVKEVIALVAGSIIQMIPLEDIEPEILQSFMPSVKLHLNKVLSSVLAVLELDVSQDLLVPQLTKSLEIGVQILSDLEILVTYINNNCEHVSISFVFNLPKNVAEIINQVFIHCQRSKEDYKEAFPAMRSELMNLFQKCHKLQLSLFTLLNETVTFNCTFESQLSLLVEVLDILGSMAEVVAELDTMSLVTHWKGYAQLTQTHAAHLKQRLDVAGPINYLSANISKQLCGLNSVTVEDKKVVLRTLKISSLQLKVLIKLCEHFKDYLGDCHKGLLNCVVTLVAHTGQYLKQQGLSDDIIAQVTAHISAGAAPLLTHLITDPHFVKEYFDHSEMLHSRSLTFQLGYCHLTNMIIKKLIQLSSRDLDEQGPSVVPTLPLIDTVFLIIKQGSTSGEMLLIQEGDIYEALLVHTAAFIVVTCTHNMFPSVENTLMKHLLQPSLWPAMFSSDLLCLVGRLGTSELCFQLTCLLHEVLMSWPPCDRARPEWVYVSWTLNRLICLLSSEHLQVIHSRLPSHSVLSSDITTLLSVPVTDKSVSLFPSVVDKLSCLRVDSEVCPSTQALFELWQCMAAPSEVMTIENSHWVLSLYSALISATCKTVNLFNSRQIVSILDVLLKLCINKSSLFHVGACEFLSYLAKQTFDAASDETQICSKVASLFVRLMVDVNPITKQVTLETFAYFAHVIKYPQIIAETVSSNCQLQNEIINFIEGVPGGSSQKSITESLKSFDNFIHKCKPNNKMKLDNTDSTPSKKPKTCVSEEQFFATVKRIEHDLYSVEEYSSSNMLTDSSASSLRNISSRIDKVLKACDDFI